VGFVTDVYSLEKYVCDICKKRKIVLFFFEIFESQGILLCGKCAREKHFDLNDSPKIFTTEEAIKIARFALSLSEDEKKEAAEKLLKLSFGGT